MTESDHAKGIVIDAVDRFCRSSDQSETYDVYIVVSLSCDGGAPISRTVYAASEDDAYQAHLANYDEIIVAVHQ